MVVIFDVLLFGFYFGGWVWSVFKFTLENGIFDGDLKYGKSRFFRFFYKILLCNNL